ncbi:MerR family DNA-binding transcriptional regulator [Mycetocola zhadangensis]|uniref:HTH merR-type domain-containing protein n=1 Tax=Mycetocola zhadangensis TaxID=1164595 RepID=A0A3L7J160_9MICO|nr:MerR family DNA-binding transcriptional regulator [Mycetocola zhadangensis]RLQ84207.1 hypothetical protein D9V28_08290 [Mycetocola zhadangensis]GGE95168.1 hypothetical protein GCM10011313_17660 [Mycetocola zhadangensis]
MNDALTAGEFEAITGLTPKALRLYAERGILAPVAVDPINGYRNYQRAQGQHGIILDLLRRARVPVAELPSTSDFDFDARRQSLALQRVVEDFYLDVAERVADFDPSNFVAHSIETPAMNWVGVVVEIGFPDDMNERVEAVQELAVDTPTIDRAFAKALAELQENSANIVWTATPGDGKTSGRAMVITRPTSQVLDPAARRHLESQIHSSTGQNVAVAAGTLPRRLEVTFASVASGDPTPADEAAAGYLHALAFAHYLGQHKLTAISAHARQVVDGPALFEGPAPVSVFDVQLR